MADVEETNAEKFVRISTPRAAKACDSIRLLENLGNKKAYDYTPAQAQELIDQLYDAVDQVADKFDVPARIDLSVADGDAQMQDAAIDDDMSDEKVSEEDLVDGDIDTRIINLPEPVPAQKDWTYLALNQVGTRLGLALEACMNDDPETAKRHLVEIMRT